MAILIGLAFWLGYEKCQRHAFWDSYKRELAVTRMMSKTDLSDAGGRQLNELLDISIYGYFLADKRGQSDDQCHEIEDILIDLIRWKKSRGYAIGPQEPLVQLQVKDGELDTAELTQPFSEYQTRLNSFLEENKERIQQSGPAYPPQSVGSADP